MKKIIKTMLMLCMLMSSDGELFGIAQNYQIIDLGLQKYTASRPTSINNQGWVTGILSDEGYKTIFVLDQNRQIALRHQPRVSTRLHINNHNEIYGSAIFRSRDASWTFDSEQIFKWINPFKYYQYFHFYYLGAAQYSSAFNFKNNVVWDANDLGQLIVMNAQTISEATDEFAKTSVWLYDNGSFHKLNLNDFQAGFKINNQSQILGLCTTGSTLSGDRKEQVAIFDYNNKKVVRLNFPGNALGIDLNDLGQFVGIFYNPFQKLWNGFLAESSGEMIELQDFYPLAMNNKGDIIGDYLASGKEGPPAVWDNGRVRPISEYLQSMVDDKGNTWDSIQSICDINDDGLIIGQGMINGKMSSLMLKPCN